MGKNGRDGQVVGAVRSPERLHSAVNTKKKGSGSCTRGKGWSLTTTFISKWSSVLSAIKQGWLVITGVCVNTRRDKWSPHSRSWSRTRRDLEHRQRPGHLEHLNTGNTRTPAETGAPRNTGTPGIPAETGIPRNTRTPRTPPAPQPTARAGSGVRGGRGAEGRRAPIGWRREAGEPEPCDWLLPAAGRSGVWWCLARAARGSGLARPGPSRPRVPGPAAVPLPLRRPRWVAVTRPGRGARGQSHGYRVLTVGGCLWCFTPAVCSPHRACTAPLREGVRAMAGPDPLCLSCSPLVLPFLLLFPMSSLPGAPLSPFFPPIHPLSPASPSSSPFPVGPSPSRVTGSSLILLFYSL